MIVWNTSKVKAGEYSVFVTVTDKSKNNVEASLPFCIKKLQLKKCKLNKSTVKRKQKVKVTALAVAGKGKVSYKYLVKLKNKTVASKKYSTSKSYSFIPKKKGTYTITVYVKDGSKAQLKKYLKLRVK